MGISLGTVTFSAGELDMDWVDRDSWQPVGQSRRYALSGAIHVQENARAGRPITLVFQPPYFGWLLAATLGSLYQLAQAVGATHSFVWGAESYSVMFRRDVQPIEVQEINPMKTHYTGTIRLIEV